MDHSIPSTKQTLVLGAKGNIRSSYQLLRECLQSPWRRERWCRLCIRMHIGWIRYWRGVIEEHEESEESDVE
jgi:hypothetical protein